jgi:hypothetical protein
VTHAERASRLFIPVPVQKLPASLASTRDEIARYAHDHSDLSEQMQALHIAAEAARRIRALAAGCECSAPMNDFAEQIEVSAYPLENEAMRWDDERDDRRHRNSLDRSRVWRPCDLPNAAE